MDDRKVKKAKTREGAEWGNSDKSKGVSRRSGHRHHRHVSGDCEWHSRDRAARRSARALGVHPGGKVKTRSFVPMSDPAVLVVKPVDAAPVVW